VMPYQVSSNVYPGTITDVAASTSIDVTDASTNFSGFCSSPYVWTLAKVSGGYTLKNAYTNKYATVTSNNNYGQASDSPVTLTVADAGSGVFTVTSQTYTSRSLQFNYNSGNTRFAFYASAQKSLYFIPVSSFTYTLATPTIDASSSGSTITVSWDAVENASGYTVTCTGETDQSLGSGVTSTTFEDLSDGSYTVTVTAVGSGSYSNSFPASSTVVISSAASASETITFSTFGYSNGADVTTVSGTTIGLVFDKGSGSNAPKYYTTGTGVRTYNGNTITVTASDKTIIKIEFTFQSGYSMTCSAVTPGSYSDGTWTGSGTSIVFTSSNTNRIQSIKVTYED